MKKIYFYHIFLLKLLKKSLQILKIYIWTGYLYEELQKKDNAKINQILSMADFLIDGPYVDSLRDITLEMRWCSNQRIIPLNVDNVKNMI